MGVEHSPEPRGRRRQAPGRSDQPVDARVDHLPSPDVHHRFLRHELQLDDPEHWQRGRLRAARRDLAYSVWRPGGGVVAAAQTVICRGKKATELWFRCLLIISVASPKLRLVRNS